MKKHVISYLLAIIYVSFLVFGFYKMHMAGYSLVFLTLTIIYALNMSLTLVIFLQQRPFSAKLAWLMVIMLIPIIGHILFMIFGHRYGNRQDLALYHARATFQYETLGGHDDDLLKTQSNISRRGIYNAYLTFYEFGNDAFDALFQDIAHAQKHIHMHYYIIKPGEIYDQFKNLLIQKAQAGLEIRLIVDDFGRWAMPAHEIRDLINNNIQVHVFGQVFFPFIHAANVYRTHRKIVLIDGKIAHVGGINIGDEYVSLAPRYGKWIDLQVKIEGQAIISHALLFIEDWQQMTHEFLDPAKYLIANKGGNNKTVLVEDAPEINVNIWHDSLLNLILNARRHIIIATPYFVPSQTIIDALKFTVQKGVVIKIFTPGLHDKKIAWHISNYYIYELLASGIKFYRTNNIFLHTKAGIFDDSIAYFGTANIDKRSFYAQFEFINFFHGQGIKELRQIFNHYEAISTPIKLEPHPSKIKQLFYRFFVNIFSPLI